MSKKDGLMKLATTLAAVGLVLSLTACGGGASEYSIPPTTPDVDPSEVLADERERFDELTGTIFRELPDKTWVVCVYFEGVRKGGIDCDFENRYEAVPEEYRGK